MEFLPTQSNNQDEGRDLQHLSELLKEDINNLREWTKGLPSQFGYYTFFIPKQSGNKRRIEAPDDSLKELKLKVYKKLLKYEAIPTVSTGFVIKRSIVNNALPHLKSKVIIKLDLKDFFSSIKEKRVYRYWLGSGWNEETSIALTNICCNDGRLPQGASTSPALSNIVNRVFDGLMLDLVTRYSGRYTRYADDLTISFPDKIKKPESKIRPLILEIKKLLKKEKYKIQFEKGIKVLRQHQRQIVTGLVVNQGLRIPREKRRLIRSMRHKATLGILTPQDLKRLEGYELFYKMVEPNNLTKINDQNLPKNEKIQIINNGGQIIIMNANGDIIGGDKITAGDNNGGIQNIGKFQNVVSSLNKSGNKELADAILQLTQAIVNSEHLSDSEKDSHSDALKQIGEEATKEKPNKTVLKYMWEGLSSTLKVVPDVAKAIATVAPLIAPFLM